MGCGFDVVYAPHRPVWVPVDGTATLAVGMLVYYGKATPANTGGAIVMPAAGGISNLSNFFVPWGVVMATNNATPNSTALATALVTPTDQITGVNTAAAQLARDWRGAEGMYAKGDPQPLVQVMRITPETVLRGYFRNSATVGTTNILTKTTDATTYTTTAITAQATFGFTAVAQNATTYCVLGTNAGLYRVRTDTGTAITTYTRAWPNTPGATDTFKSVNVRQGLCRMQFDTTYGMWIDNTAALTSDYYVVNVLKLELGVDPGECYAEFSFSTENFLPSAGGRTVITT